MDKNTITGFALLAALFIGLQWYISPSEAELKAEQRAQDSLAAVVKREDSLKNAPKTADAPISAKNDTLAQQQLQGKLGAFSAAGVGTGENVTLENEVLKLVFNTKGAQITSATMKNYKKFVPSQAKTSEFVKEPVVLLGNKAGQSSMTLSFPVNGAGKISTNDLVFVPKVVGNTITFTASAGEGKFLEETYELPANTYTLKYKVRTVGLQDVITSDKIAIDWTSYLDKLEKSPKYEATMTALNYKQSDEKPTYLSFGANDEKTLSDKPLSWVSHTQQFFNTTLIAEKNFSAAATVKSVKPEDIETSKTLMTMHTSLSIPYGKTGDETFAMRYYIGPNDYDKLKAENTALEAVIPFGWSIFRLINVYAIRPLFLFLYGIVPFAGICILLLTLLIKALLYYPLTYKTIISQIRMGLLKPKLEELKKKFGDDTQGLQVEQMKLNSSYGVNPLGGCLPMLAQLPIWFALYRFFPASLEFRQQSFMWADDLSSYDSILNFGFSIPFYGDHVSLFALLWTITTLAYSYYNSKDMDFSANPAMKYMQYITPVIFLGIFNSNAAGLACYLAFSNILNIGQTLITKAFVDKDAMAAEMEHNKNNPKPKSGWQAKIQEAMAAQQELQKQQQTQQNKGKK